MVNPHAEAHRGEHAGWLRAAVLGANDGLVSTASLMVGVAPAAPPQPRCLPRTDETPLLPTKRVNLIAGKAHAVAGLYPMASIRSRSDTKLTENAPAPMAPTAHTAHR